MSELACLCVHVCEPCPWRRRCTCVMAAWFTVSQLWTERTGHPERKPQRSKLRFPATSQPNTLTKSHLTGPAYRKWKRKPHSSILSSIPVSALRFTWIALVGRSGGWESPMVAKQQWKNWLRLETVCCRGSNVWPVDFHPQREWGQWVPLLWMQNEKIWI